MKSAHDDDDQTSDGHRCFVIMNQRHHATESVMDIVGLSLMHEYSDITEDVRDVVSQS